ncbi:sensor histidine kinase [Salinibius halmophilus]|uniref:sensor histidine kinase n=1 Tax=Salinibius halmophilus TaxID=1853216 RepID=UPI000E666C0E|nr:ATP-binding protein [Salinibius halmophilus]
MNINPLWLLLLGGSYLLVLFAVAYSADRFSALKKLSNKPSIFVLSLGVYCSGWAFYGSIGFAFEAGLTYLTYYVGFTLAALFAGILLYPILRIVRNKQLSSLADVMAYRYHSKAAGLATTIALLLATLPLMVLQIQAVTASITLLGSPPPTLGDPTPGISATDTAFIYCFVLIIFTMLFGARNSHPNEQNDGLRLALATEAVFKLVAFVAVGIYAVWQVFGGIAPMNEWLANNPRSTAALYDSMSPLTWLAMLAMFALSPLLMPYVFLTMFKGQHGAAHIRKAAVWFPVYLLIMSLPVLPILWAGIAQTHPSFPEQFPIGIGIANNDKWLGILAYLGGLSAASGALITLTLSLTSMVMNHLVLPYYRPHDRVDIHALLLWQRRWILFAIITLAYIFYVALQQIHPLTRLGLVSFVGVIQLLPGLIGLLLWPQASSRAFVIGLAVGLGTWFVTLLVPLWTDARLLIFNSISYMNAGFSDEGRFWLAGFATAANLITFIAISVFRPANDAEQAAAENCVINTPVRPRKRTLSVDSIDEMEDLLAKPLGQVVAEREVSKALRDLGFKRTEFRPFALRKVRERIEANLSGLLGPSAARILIDKHLPWQAIDQGAADLNQFEQELEGLHDRLTGMAAELDLLRRHHKETLLSMPIGVCSLNDDGEIVLWNPELASITGLAIDDALGHEVEDLPEPWQSVISEFLDSNEQASYRKRLEVNKSPRWLNLQKAAVLSHRAGTRGTIILIEDQTEFRVLENQLMHSERLASIGSLAAGVAHEIGNPVTNIDCLAQDMKYAQDMQEVQEVSGQIIDQTRRISRIMQSLTNFAHAGQEQHGSGSEDYSIRKLIEEAIHLVTLSKQRNNVLFINRCEDSLLIRCEPQRLSQVFINLLNNAADASPNGGDVVISSQQEEHSVIVTVEDQGTGIPGEVIDRIFDPFFTTKEVGKGTGLGLFLTFAIIEEHYGQISVDSPANPLSKRGTKFTIRLPGALKRESIE